jgi:hypothetical protein
VAAEEDFGRNLPETAVHSCTVLIAFQEPVAAPRLLVVLEAGEVEEPRGSQIAVAAMMAMVLTQGLRADC